MVNINYLFQDGADLTEKNHIKFRLSIKCELKTK